jgi:Fe2+ transport system protein FeoA
MKNLCDIKDGETAAVILIYGGRMAQQRLLELGYCRGKG